MRKTIPWILGLALAATVMPANAYHIDGTPNLANTPCETDAALAVTTADWCLDPASNPILLLIICESEGALDDRNSYPVAAGPRHGTGGLCTTGTNDASGGADIAVPGGAIAPAPPG